MELTESVQVQLSISTLITMKLVVMGLRHFHQFRRLHNHISQLINHLRQLTFCQISSLFTKPQSYIFGQCNCYFQFIVCLLSLHIKQLNGFENVSVMIDVNQHFGLLQISCYFLTEVSIILQSQQPAQKAQLTKKNLGVLRKWSPLLPTTIQKGVQAKDFLSSLRGSVDQSVYLSVKKMSKTRFREHL